MIESNNSFKETKQPEEVQETKTSSLDKLQKNLEKMASKINELFSDDSENCNNKEQERTTESEETSEVKDAGKNNQEGENDNSYSIKDLFDQLFSDDFLDNMKQTNEVSENNSEESSVETVDNSSENNEKKLLTEEEKKQKILDFIDGKVEFEEVKEIFAEKYAEAVNSNKTWTWGETIPGGDELTAKQRQDIIEYAREKGLVPNVSVRYENGKRYADFSEYAVYECVLDEEYWDKTDEEQFKKCNEMLKKAIEDNPELAKQFTEEQLEEIMNGKTPTGYIWHHSEKDGTMQLVSFGVHKSTNHHGGRSEGNWADAPRY